MIMLKLFVVQLCIFLVLDLAVFLSGRQTMSQYLVELGRGSRVFRVLLLAILVVAATLLAFHFEVTR